MNEIVGFYGVIQGDTVIQHGVSSLLNSGWVGTKSKDSRLSYVWDYTRCLFLLRRCYRHQGDLNHALRRYVYEEQLSRHSRR